jgi:hypothetical protein
MLVNVLLPAILVEAVYDIVVVSDKCLRVIALLPAILVQAVSDIDVVVQVNAFGLMFSYLRYLSRLFTT